MKGESWLMSECDDLLQTNPIREKMKFFFMSRSRSTRNFTSLSAHPYVGFESHKNCRLQQFNIMVKNFYRDVPEKVSEKNLFSNSFKNAKKLGNMFYSCSSSKHAIRSLPTKTTLMISKTRQPKKHLFLVGRHKACLQWLQLPRIPTE